MYKNRFCPFFPLITSYLGNTCALVFPLMGYLFLWDTGQLGEYLCGDKKL